MISTNIVVATFMGNSRYTSTENLWAIDYGQILQIEGLELPQTFEVHFSKDGAEAQTQIGTYDSDTGVGLVNFIDEQLQSDGKITAYIYLHTGESDGETEYRIQTIVKPRPNVTPLEPTPVQQDAITQAIAQLNVAVEQTAQDVETTNTNAETTRQYRDDAETFCERAESAQRNALISETNASSSATSASQSAQNASQSASSALESAQNAYRDAERAEQAVGTTGYMYFYINEDGDLIYQRTSNAQVDFYLNEGDLYVRASE